MYWKALLYETILNEQSPQNTLDLYFDSSIVSLEFAPAEVLDAQNQSPVLTYSVYQMYFSERDFDESRFLSKLSTSMLQLNDIKTNGMLVDANFVFPHNNKSRLIYSAYPGTAIIFSVIVTTTYPSGIVPQDMEFLRSATKTLFYSYRLPSFSIFWKKNL